jgi:hypothetical protein
MCLIKLHNIKVHGRVEVYIHAFLTSMLDGGDSLASHPGAFTPAETSR